MIRFIAVLLLAASASCQNVNRQEGIQQFDYGPSSYAGMQQGGRRMSMMGSPGVEQMMGGQMMGSQMMSGQMMGGPMTGGPYRRMMAMMPMHMGRTTFVGPPIVETAIVSEPFVGAGMMGGGMAIDYEPYYEGMAMGGGQMMGSGMAMGNAMMGGGMMGPGMMSPGMMSMGPGMMSMSPGMMSMGPGMMSMGPGYMSSGYVVQQPMMQVGYVQPAVAMMRPSMVMMPGPITGTTVEHRAVVAPAKVVGVQTVSRPFQIWDEEEGAYVDAPEGYGEEEE